MRVAVIVCLVSGLLLPVSTFAAGPGRGHVGPRTAPPTGRFANAGVTEGSEAAAGAAHAHSGHSRGNMNRVDAGQGQSRGQGTARSSAARSNSASGLNHALKGAGNGRAGADRAGDAGQDNAERIRDQRVSQANHLRDISGRNGNERLQATADRMEASAKRNYDRRVTPTPTVDPSSDQ